MAQRHAGREAGRCRGGDSMLQIQGTAVLAPPGWPGRPTGAGVCGRRGCVAARCSTACQRDSPLSGTPWARRLSQARSFHLLAHTWTKKWWRGGRVGWGEVGWARGRLEGTSGGSAHAWKKLPVSSQTGFSGRVGGVAGCEGRVRPPNPRNTKQRYKTRKTAPCRWHARPPPSRRCPRPSRPQRGRGPPLPPPRPAGRQSLRQAAGG